MKDAIPVAILTALSCELGNDELGAAVRIISRMCETRRPISKRTAHIAAGMDKQSWMTIEEDVLAFFAVTETEISLPEAASVDTTDESVQVVSLKETQGEMNMIVRQSRRATVPQYATTERPPNVSIRSVIYNQAVDLFKGAGQSEKTARAILASMLKSYPEGDVATVLADAVKKDALAEPHTWMFGRLRALAQQRSRVAPSSSPAKNKLVTPELAGISQARAEHIRAKNANLRNRGLPA